MNLGCPNAEPDPLVDSRQAWAEIMAWYFETLQEMLADRCPDQQCSLTLDDPRLGDRQRPHSFNICFGSKTVIADYTCLCGWEWERLWKLPGWEYLK